MAELGAGRAVYKGDSGGTVVPSFAFLSYSILALLAFWPAFLPGTALAQTVADTNQVAENITLSMAYLPGLITGAAYLLGIVLAATGVIKLKEHIEDPRGTKINAGLTRLFTGGALFALPTILSTMVQAISGGTLSGLSISSTSSAQIGAITQTASSTGTSGFNDVLTHIVDSISYTPGLITAVAYFLGLLLAYAAILKIRDHVESPENTKLSEGIIRLLVGGALFSLPTIYEAMYTTVTGGAGTGTGFLASLISDEGGFLNSNQASAACSSEKSTFGSAICRVVQYSALMPSFLTAISYLFGLVLGMWAMLKIRDHVLDPRSTPIWDGVAKLIAGGAFFALPYILDIAAATVTDGTLAVGTANTGFNESSAQGSSCAPAGLDMAMYCLMSDIFAPLHVAINFFALMAGIVFIMIGIGRLMKNAQDGAKGPGGIGTLATFLTGGILLSANSMLGAFSETLFNDNRVLTYATLSYTDGLQKAEIDHVNVVISAIVKFMIVVGIISFVRGWLIMRDVAEGNGQASVMAGTTHIIGGALAVNLGPLLSAVQETLGISGLGITFGSG